MQSPRNVKGPGTVNAEPLNQHQYIHYGQGTLPCAFLNVKEKKAAKPLRPSWPFLEMYMGRRKERGTWGIGKDREGLGEEEVPLRIFGTPLPQENSRGEGGHPHPQVARIVNKMCFFLDPCPTTEIQN